ncbi:MAG: hypothetical protein IJK51_03690 [Bacteroidaceae bacterium]|nr:hypothetical protein [Bacteroidaceae bacterium]
MKTFKYLGTLLLLAMVWACSNDNEIVKPESVQPVSDGITFTATFGVKNGTSRALSDPDDGTLKASWQQGEEIAIVFGGDKYTATVTEVDADGSATVTATLPAGTPNNQPVIYIYPASAADGNGLRGDVLSSQDGTLATLSSTLDIATANGTLVVDGTTAQPNGTVTLVNQFAICKFQFTDENEQAIENITSLTITDLATTEVITVTTPSPMAAVYVAMMPSNNSTKFEVTDAEGNIYQKTSSAHLEAGKFYRPTLKAIFFDDPLKTPLTFEAIEAGAEVGCFNDWNPRTVLQYRINGGEWTDYTMNERITLANVGDKISFRGDNHETTGDALDRFLCYAPCYVYGNIMSLLYKENFATATTLPRDYVFARVFCGSEENIRPIYSHPTKDLLLPATTLTSNCYEGTFRYTNLSRVPDLPARELTSKCYWTMFEGCPNLTTAPEKLPATTLVEGCYSRMFYGCTALTRAPVLPAPTLVESCYYCMFYGCTSLNYVECLATSFGSYSTYKWLDGVSSTGTFTKAAGVTWQTGISDIPEGWTVVEK